MIMTVRSSGSRGFTLIEVLFTLVLFGLLTGLSLYTLKPANSKAPTRGMALALEEELAAARQLAISSGHPVALGIPTESGSAPAASSVYRLEGWNLPTITWSKGFAGDYPEVGFAAARWAGGSDWDNNLPPSDVAKLAGFQLSRWLPSKHADDYIFCFTPEGGLVTNNLWAQNGRYTVVVGRNLQVAGRVVSAGDQPVTLLISPYGGIEAVTGVPGSSLPSSGTASPISEPAHLTQPGPGEVRLSNIVVTPRIEGGPENEGVCVPGQYVTLEVYAYDPQGRGLFAKWKQPGRKGIFTYPDGKAGTGAILESEVERMEFVNEQPPGLTWTGTSPPAGGLFRARWGWTVPMNSAPGDTYEIEVDVKDAKGEVHIVNPPEKIIYKPAPDGKVIVEKNIGGIWQLVQMNPDGSNHRILSPPGVEETMASIDSAGTKMAFLQGAGGGQTRVKVRALDGGYERSIAGPGPFTSVSLSPNGTWISYRNNNAGTTGILTTQKVDGSGSVPNFTQALPGSTAPYPRSRTGWSRDSEFMFYEGSADIRWRNLNTGADGLLVGQIRNTSGGIEQLYAPVGYRAPVPSLGQERVLFSLGAFNPVLMSVPVNRSGGGITTVLNGGNYGDFTTSPSSAGQNMFVDIDGGGGGAGSGGLDDCYPNISTDNRWLILNRTPQGTSIDLTPQTTLFIAMNGQGNYEGGSPTTTRVMTGDIRRAIWVP